MSRHQPAQTQSQRPNAPTPEHLNTRTPEHPANPMPPMYLIPWEQIVPNPNQPRRRFDLAALQELADSIQQHGILQPHRRCLRLAAARHQCSRLRLDPKSRPSPLAVADSLLNLPPLTKKNPSPFQGEGQG